MTKMLEPIPYLDLAAQMRPIRKEIDAAIARALDNCTFCLGPDVEQFERNFAAWCGAQHCVGVNSGTSALHLALLLLGVGARRRSNHNAIHICGDKLGHFVCRRATGLCGY
jgi:cystathionine beta-lyase/cystathionine gamma-synthase